MNCNKKSLKYVLFEDERLSKMFIEQTISNLRPSYHMSGEASNVANIEQVLSRTRPDFIISGIRLSDGLSVDEYKRINCKLPTVFFTSYCDMLPRINGLNVVHTALKPVAVSEVEITLRKIEEVLGIS